MHVNIVILFPVYGLTSLLKFLLFKLQFPIQALFLPTMSGKKRAGYTQLPQTNLGQILKI